MDSENIRMAEWLQMLGCPIVLRPVDFQRLNTPKMRSVWRHLREQVKPLRTVQTVRQNLLLSKLYNQNMLPDNFGNFRIQSIQELSQLHNMSGIQEEIIYLKKKVKVIDEKMQKTSYTLITKSNEKESLRHELMEHENKTVLLRLYQSRIQKDVEEVNVEIDNTNCFKIPQNLVSFTDMKNNKSTVVNYLNKCIVPTSETFDDAVLNDMILLTLEFPAITMYEGIVKVSSNALRSLNKCRTNLDISSCVKLKEEAVSDMYPFLKHLSNLNRLVFQNELDLSNSLDKVNEYSAKLEREKLTLKSVIEKICMHDSVGIDDEDLSPEECISSLVENTISLKAAEQSIVRNNELEVECIDYDDLKLQVEQLGTDEETLFENVDKKVSEVNHYISLILNSKLVGVKSTVLKTCSEQVSHFFDELRQQNEDSEALFLSYKSIINKECEIILNEPLTAVLRKWEESCELLSNNLVRDISKNPALLSLLLQSQPKNILKSTLEKVSWSHAIDYW
uniref:Uncharacterized protein n=1 Tax=Graphocephala atropunctata TaxID=36148 RepID=A0A1B6KF17_9HEMI